MTASKWIRLFFRTLIIGAISSIFVSVFVRFDAYEGVFAPFQLFELFGLLVFFTTLGLVFSVISQTGFFAYLFLNRFCIGLFKSYWPTVQVVLIAFVLFDLVYFPYQATKGDVNIIWYILMALGIFLYGLWIASIKAKETKKQSFIPALFFMVVITTVEWIPALQVQGTEYATLMIFPLLICNTYQILMLHRLINSN